MLNNLLERGLNTESGLLVVIDGSKALSTAIKSIFGDKALIQRCQIHKMRNVLDYLSKEKHDWARKGLRDAWTTANPDFARQKLHELAASLDKTYPGAAASIREGLEETITINKLGISEKLWRTLRCTNVIESAFDTVCYHSRNAKNWQNGQQALRWAAAGALMAESNFHRINGYQDLPLLCIAIKRA